MRNLFLCFFTCAGLIFATSAYPRYLNDHLNVSNQTEYSILIEKRSSTCFEGFDARLNVMAGANKRLYTVSIAHPHTQADVQSCSILYFVYADTRGGKNLIGFLKLKLVPIEYFKPNDTRPNYCEKTKAGKFYINKANKNGLTRSITATVNGVSSCNEVASVKFNGP